MTFATREHFSNYIDAQLSGLTEGRAYPDLQHDTPKGKGNPVSCHSAWVTGSYGVKEGFRHTSCEVILKSKQQHTNACFCFKRGSRQLLPRAPVNIGIHYT